MTKYTAVCTITFRIEGIEEDEELVNAWDIESTLEYSLPDVNLDFQSKYTGNTFPSIEKVSAMVVEVESEQ